MTHYNVDYSGMDEVAKHNKAIEDIKEYMGEERFTKLTALLKEDSYTLSQFEMAVSFAGVQGYPAKAWYNYCFPL
jgi:hypothetical protein